MAITTLSPEDTGGVPHSKAKIVSIVLLFLLSLVSFICQTEFTSQAYQLGYSEPLVLLLATHGLWWILWPVQAVAVSAYRTYQKWRVTSSQGKTVFADSDPSSIQYQRLSHAPLLEQEPSEGLQISAKKINYVSYFKKSVVKQIHNVYHTSILVYEANVNDDRQSEVNTLIDQNPKISSSSSITAAIRDLLLTPSLKYIIKQTFLISIVLTVAGTTWYAAMGMTYASDVTAIYNCSAFTAYAFAIPILHDKFLWLKASSVVIALLGVFIVAYSDEAPAEEVQAKKELYPYRFWGNLIILAGAILYGYYEVIYKKYTCIPEHLTKLITPRRQMTFANFIMVFLGLFSCLILFVVIVLAQVLGIHDFVLLKNSDGTHDGLIWFYFFGSIVSNVLFSASFLSLMALTSPVLSSVSSLLTIFLIGVVEWVLFGNALSTQQLAGDFLVILGFTILTVASWNEISEGKDDDDVEQISTYSFAVSTTSTI